jgi:plasmid maintenance system antidote protein VapI
MMDLGTWMHENRWTQPQLAKKIGISRPTISGILNKKRDVTLRTAMAIVKFTKNQVTYEDLTREE